MCSINKDKLYLANIFMIDWDDTLFPTSWVNLNSIDLMDTKSKNECRLYFLELDKVISTFMKTLTKIGDIYIVTNASLKWIKNCLSVLDLTTSEIIKNKIRLVSARDSYSLIKTSPIDWKIYTFQDIMDDIINDVVTKIKSETYFNIISIGDADYEYIALMNLNNYFIEKNSNLNYLLKSIKFIEKPELYHIMNQINVLLSNKEFIINKIGFLDLKLSKL